MSNWKMVGAIALWAWVATSAYADGPTEKPAEEAAAKPAEKPFYLTLDTPPAPELSTAAALRSFTIAPGFTVELVAAEPLVEDPVAITWDEQGHLYVVEMRGFMPDAYGSNEKAPVGTVVRLSDSSGDGVFDTRQVLLDKLILPRAVAIVNAGLLVGEPPNLWLCPSHSGLAQDIDCRAKRNLGTYGDQPGSVEHAENGLLTGLDNWLYNAKSNRRLQLRGVELVVEPTLFRGQWGITQDNNGRLYYNTNSNLLLGDAYDAQPVITAGNATAPGLSEPISRDDQLFAVRVNPGVNRAYVPGVLRPDGRLNRPTSASGMAVYRGDQFPAELAGDVFVAEPAANAVAQLRLQHAGLSIRAEHILYPHPQWKQVEFLASTDERFRPVDVAVGPDGALYVVDMYRGIIQDHVFLSDELRAQALARQLDKPVGKGRIWRIRANTSALRRITPDLAAAGTTALLQLLAHANAWQRHTAQRLLLARQDHNLNSQLDEMVSKGGAYQAVHALWTLSGRNALVRATVRKALARSEPSVRLAALRAGREQLTRTDLLALANDTADPVLTQHQLLYLAPHNTHADVRAYLVRALTANALDTYHPSAIKAASYQQELPLLDALHQQGGWSGELEQQTGFVRTLVAQGLRANPTSAVQLLDLAASGPAQTSSASAGKKVERWMQMAILNGMYDASREPSFTRVLLAEPHAIFLPTDKTRDETRSKTLEESPHQTPTSILEPSQEPTLWPGIARARRAVTWPGDELAANMQPLSPAQQQRHAAGLDFYRARCAACHGEDGRGIASLGPPLADSPWVTGSSERLARIILHGLQGPIEVAGKTWDSLMPGHGGQAELSDEVAAGLLTYLQRAWGHTGRAIDVGFVTKIRQQTANRKALWTVPELLSIDINTHYQRYVGGYGNSAFRVDFVYDGQQLLVKSGIFNGPLAPQQEDHFLFAPRQIRFEFVRDDDGSVVALRMPGANGEVELPRVAG